MMDGALPLKIGNTARRPCFSAQFTFSLKALPALKTGVLLAAILISAPVAGFLPVLASLCLQEKVPKPTSVTGSRAARESRINGGSCCLLGESSLSSNFLGQFCFVHCIGSFFPTRKGVVFIF